MPGVSYSWTAARARRRRSEGDTPSSPLELYVLGVGVSMHSLCVFARTPAAVHVCIIRFSFVLPFPATQEPSYPSTPNSATLFRRKFSARRLSFHFFRARSSPVPFRAVFPFFTSHPCRRGGGNLGTREEVDSIALTPRAFFAVQAEESEGIRARRTF